VRVGLAGPKRSRTLKKITLFVLAFAVSAPAHGQSPSPLTSGARFHYAIIKGYVTRAAAKMPEEHYPFRPIPEIRTFAQLIGHLADSNYRICSVLVGAAPPMDAGIEKNKKTKGDLIKALGESFTYCDKVYADMTDEAGKPIVKFDAGGEGSRVPIQMPRLTVLAFHAGHAFEHYGNIVTYMRLKGLVPPSSEPPFGAYSPP
jgi:uncharacterized damage-inducible protein DinB